MSIVRYMGSSRRRWPGDVGMDAPGGKLEILPKRVRELFSNLPRVQLKQLCFLVIAILLHNLGYRYGMLRWR
jgi:hypothetical protein